MRNPTVLGGLPQAAARSARYLLFSIGLAACTDAPMTPKPIVGDGRALASLSEAELLDRQSAIIDALVELTPEAHREAARTAYARAVQGGGPIHTSDNKHALKVAALNATVAERRRRLSGAAVMPNGPEEELMRVSVGFVPDLHKASLRSVLLRDPEDGGVPILLLRVADATPDDLAAGLAAARLSRHNDGTVTARRLKIEIGRTEVRAPATSALLDRIRKGVGASQPKRIAGFGQVATIEIATPIHKSR